MIILETGFGLERRSFWVTGYVLSHPACY